MAVTRKSWPVQPSVHLRPSEKVLEPDHSGAIGERRLAELAQQFDVHPNWVTEWEVAAGTSARRGWVDALSSEPPVDVTARHAKIGS